MGDDFPDEGTKQLPDPQFDSDDRFRAIFDAVNDAIFIMNTSTGEVLEVNRAACQMFGYERDELIGINVMGKLSSGIPPYTEEMAFERVGKTSVLGDPEIVEWQSKRKDGTLFWTEVSVRYTQLDHIPVMISILRDVTERKRMDAEIVYQAQHDVLTGLANRSTFTTALDRAIAKSLRTGKPFAVLSLDLDRFKDVNDTRGHPAGDHLLRLVAGRLQTGVRSHECVARFGGDEFAILLSDLEEPTETAALAARFIAAIGEPFLIDGHESHVGASIGIAVYDDDACDAETLLSQADIALYRAKFEGRNIYRFYSEAMNVEVKSRVALTDELRQAIPGGQLFLAYQPQVNAKTGRVFGVEALVRWRHPRRGVLLPKDFLPVAESSGLIGALDQWVLREACRQGRKWIDAGIAPAMIGVNISTAQFNVPLGLERHVFAALAETRLPPSMLELEINESTLISLSPEHGDMIQRLRRAGVRFSLDDFGTGHSSLNYLRRFSVDRIKIAQEFISELATSNHAASIVSLIVRLARDLGNAVIAEGVETHEQVSLLQGLDCDDVQGFYFAHPMSAEAIAPVLSAGTIERPAAKVAAFAA